MEEGRLLCYFAGVAAGLRCVCPVCILGSPLFPSWWLKSRDGDGEDDDRRRRRRRETETEETKSDFPTLPACIIFSVVVEPSLYGVGVFREAEAAVT